MMQSPLLTLTVQQGPQRGRRFSVAKDSIIIGRVAGSDVVINDSEVSRRHASITWERGQPVIRDVGSTNGTLVNGVRITGPQALRDGDTIGLGKIPVSFHSPAEEKEAAQVVEQPEPAAPEKPAVLEKEGCLSRHFETVIAICIAIVTVTGAFVAWRASTAGGSAADAERQGILSAVSRERVQTDHRTRLYNDLRIFTDYIQNQDIASLLKQDAQKLGEMGQTERAESLLREADVHEDLADSAYGFLDYPQYVREDNMGRKTYDAEGYLQASLAIETRTQDLNPDDDFREADRLHLLKQWLVGIVIVLAVALLFLTLAQITQSFLRYIFFTIGLFAFLTALAIGTVIEVTALLQRF